MDEEQVMRERSNLLREIGELGYENQQLREQVDLLKGQLEVAQETIRGLKGHNQVDTAKREVDQAEIAALKARVEELEFLQSTEFTIFGADGNLLVNGSVGEVITKFGQIMHQLQIEATTQRLALEAIEPYVKEKYGIDGEVCNQVYTAVDGSAGRTLAARIDKLEKLLVAAEAVVEQHWNATDTELQALRSAVEAFNNQQQKQEQK